MTKPLPRNYEEGTLGQLERALADLILDAKGAFRDFPATQNGKMEMTMRKKILTVFVVPLIAALTVQAAAASERHHTRTKARAVASERLRNSNAYYAAPRDTPVPSYWSNVDEGAMSSGLAGH